MTRFVAEAGCRQWVLFAGLVVLIIGLSSCVRSDSVVRPIVVTSVLPQAYFVERLAGDAIMVEALIPPGANPSAWEPSIRQMRALGAAKLYVEVGHPHFPFEQTWLDRLLADNPELPRFDCSEGLEVLHDDPHLWVSPATVGKLVPRLADRLVSLLPAAAADIRTNERAFMSEIAALDSRLREIAAAADRKRFYVFHPAWSYLARDYGLVQVAIEKGHKEPSPKDLAATIAAAKAEGVRSIFSQTQFSAHSPEMIAEAIGGSVVFLDPLAYDWPISVREVAAALEYELESSGR